MSTINNNKLDPIVITAKTDIESQGFTSPERMVLKQLGEAAPDLATYQSGIKASTPIFKGGVYVLQDPYEVRKFKTDLRTADYSDIKSLLAVLGSKGYKNIPKKDDVPVAVASREDLQALSGSKTPDPLSRALNEHGNYFRDDERPDLVLVPLVAKLRTYERHHFPVPEGLNIRESLIECKMTDKAPVDFYKGYEPGLTLRRTFADLLTRATFSVELINSIAKEEESGRLGGNDSDAFKGTGIKADGGTKHKAFILERLLDLQACLRAEFQEDKPALTKIEAAITNEQLANVKQALNV